MKKLLSLAITLVLAVSLLASCQPECEHTFSENWNSDANSHWHPATCEHGEQKSGLADHTDADEDGKCDVCEHIVGHDHRFADSWSYDETHHWKDATCSHTGEKGEYSLHSDENTDGSCDGCAVHVHGVNAAGFCTFTDCGKQVVKIDESDLEVLVYALLAQSGLANGGKMDYDFTGRSNNAGDYATHSVKALDYLFGKDGYVYYKDSTTTTGATSASSGSERWYMPYGADQVFGAVSEDGGETFVPDFPEVETLTGYYFRFSTLVEGYGPENALVSIYDSLIGDNAKDVEITSHPDDNKVEVTFSTYFLNETTIAVGDDVGGVVYNLSHFDVEFSFTYTDDYALTSLDLVIDSYTNDPGELTIGVPNELDIDLDYDPETGEYTFRDNALADTYTVSITQTVGDRTEENPNPKSKFIPTGFTLYNKYNEDTGALSGKFKGEALNVNVNGVIHLYVGDCAPAGTSIHFAPELVTLKLFKDGAEVADPTSYTNETAVAMFTFTGNQRLFFFIPKVDGAYRLEIYISGEKLFDVNILAGDVDEGNITLKDNEFAVKVTETYAWANEVSFTAEKSGTYYFNLPARVGFMDADGYDAAEKTPATDDTPEPYFDYNNAKNKDGTYNPGSFKLELEAGQTVRFYVNAMNRGTYVISYAVVS